MAGVDGTNTGTSGSDQSSLLGDLWSWEAIGVFVIKLFLAIVIVIVLVILARWFSKFVEKRIRLNSIVDDDDYTKKVSGLVGDVVFYTLTLFIVFIGLSVLGIDFTFMLGGISFGLGFAFKDILGNMLAGLMVLTNNDYKLGDIIVIDDDKKDYFGRIEELTIRYTVIRTFDLRKVIIPNLKMVTKPIRTYDAEELVRLETSVTIHYSTPVAKALETIKTAVNSLKLVKEKKSTMVMVTQMGNHGLEMRVFFYMDPSTGTLIPVAISEVNQAIFDAFNKEKIVIPYPHMAVTVDHNDKNLIGTAVYIDQQKGK